MEFLTITAASQRIGISADHLRDLERAGKVKALRASDGTRLFTPKELDRFIEPRARKVR